MVKYNSSLLKAVKDDQVIFFIGSGMSQRLGLPNWSDLIESIIEVLSKDYNEYEHLNKVTHIFSEIDILDKIEIHKSRILEILQEKISINTKSLDLSCHSKLKLVSSKIITTNYDNFLELATGFNPIDYDNNFRIPRLAYEKEYIFKLHGSINDPSKCILFDSDYKELYNSSSPHAAIEKLKELIANNVFVFIGFSLSDKYVMNQFSYISKLYNNFAKKHFVITTSPEDFSKYNIETIKLDSWESLPIYLDELIKFRTNDIIESKIKIRNKIAILISEPIDKHLGYYLDDIIKPFKNYNVEIVCHHLTEKNLNNLTNDIDYVFIFSKTIKNKIIIEDVYCKSKLIDLYELEQLTAVEKAKGFFVFLNDNIKIEKIDLITLPLSIYIYHKDKFSSLIFKALRKADKNLMEEAVFCSPKLYLEKCELGNANIITFGNPRSSNIDYKNLLNFVGRITELENIIRLIIDLNNRLLTIKGSGGIGKTTIIKKVALELFQRKNFQDGIFYIDCQFIEEYEAFEYKIAQCFDIDKSLNFKEHIIENNMHRDALIILDNFEFIQNKDLFIKIKDLLYFFTDYSTVVVVSRELLELEFEVKYELKNFSTDEAEELFKKNYKVKESRTENNILRTILEDLLNNNPLAIKIITKNLPRGQNMTQLKLELEKDFFKTLEVNLNDVFNDQDKNIEKTKSIFQSINYSYTRLNLKQKLIFETLALFPSGISINNYKKFLEAKNKNKNKIYNEDIKLLDNKSLAEISNGIVKLQPIVRRFAEYQFKNRDDKLYFYNEAYQYNRTLIAFIDELHDYNETKALMLFDNELENYYLSFNYLMEVNDEISERLKYLHKLTFYFSLIEQRSKLITKLRVISNILKEEEPKFIVEIMIICSSYFEGYFDSSYAQLNEIIPLDLLSSLIKTSNNVLRNSLTNALGIYDMEGKTFDVLKCMINNDIFDCPTYDTIIFRIGLYDELAWVIKEDDNCKGFFKYEILFNNGSLNLNDLSDYINSLYKKQSIEIMQCNYILAKAGALDKKIIQKLVVVNPYTNGLKKLMQAFVEKEDLIARKYYEDAIKNLQHIKYYHLEAILYYCRYLKNNDQGSYNELLHLGLKLSYEYKYRFLIHQFLCMKNEEERVFCQSDYPLLEIDVSQYMEGVKQYIIGNKRKKGEKKRRFGQALS